MRHSRWDIKGEQQDGPKDQPRRWNNGSSQMDWSVRHEAEVHPRMPSPPRHRPGPLGTPPRLRGTPSPLDYRSESRRRHDNQSSSISQNAGGPPHTSQQSSMGPPSTHFTGSWPILAAPSLYTESNQGHHPLAQYPARLWGQNHPTYYPGDTGQYIFDLKWWEQQKQSMDAYLDGPCWRSDKNGHQNSTYPQWSFGTRVMKNYPKRHSSSSRSGSRGHPQEGSYSGQRHDTPYDHTDHRRRHLSLQRGQKHRDGMSEDHEQMESHRRPPLLADHGQKSRDGSNDAHRRNGAELRDMRKIHPAHHQPFRDSWGSNENVDKSRGGRGGKKSKQKQQNRFEFSLPSSCRGSDFSKLAKSASSGSGKIKPGGNGAIPVVMQPRFDIPSRKNKNKTKGLSSKVDDSATYAEAAKKKALAAAAKKLKRTFFAAKKKKTGGESSTVDDDDDEEEDEESGEMNEENNAQDLSMPRRHPSCLEFDIDIRFSAKEWASVGRGQGGTSNILGRPQSPSSSKKQIRITGKDDDLLGNSRFGCIGEGEEQEDSGTYSDSDLGKGGQHWSPIVASHSYARRRHLSESSGVMDLRKNPTNAAFNARPASGRVRSCSLSVVEGASSSRGEPGYSAENRTACVKLHLMPKLRRMMLKQLLTMDKKSLQELVDDPRSRKAQFMMTHLMSEHRAALSQRLNQQRFKTSGVLPEDELQLLNSLETSQLNSFPSDVVQQVREILAMEERGEGSSWEEVSLSVNDLLNADSDPDLDCQIISPPPRDPASTITIHDSDSEMEEALHNEDVRDQEEEEEEEEEEDEDDDNVEDDEEEIEAPEAHQEDSVSSEAEDSNCKREAPTPNVKQSDIMPPVPVDVPMCVMDSIGAGPSNSRDIADQVSDKISMISPNSVGVNPQRPSAQELSVPGTSSMLLTPAGLKVKEERPSPVSECGLCMHNPRTPHTSECLYPYGVTPPSPVPLMPGPPQPLGATPPQRPVPHMPTSAQQPPSLPISSSLYQRSVKQEKLDDSYLKFEHVKRPSSEERPKNPAPPDTAREELLPLPIPPPAQALHPQPHPRPLIFSPDEDFPGPPRPPPPPPPQFSPRIKLERHTPVQFMCCCMRNECERNSTHSAEMRPLSRRSVVTPQPAERRPTPHLYKMEPPSPCASRARTPHQSLPNIFAPPASPRCINNLPVTGTRVTVGVQTEKERHIPVLTYDQSCSNNYSNKRQYVPNLTLARNVTPNVITKMDQSTTTDDLVCNYEQQQQRGKGRAKSWWWHRNGRPRNCLNQLSSISNSINDFEFSANSGTALQQMMVLSEQECEFVRHLESLDQDIHELLREKRKITEELGRLHNIRVTKLQQLIRQGNGSVSAGGKVSGAEHNAPRGSSSDVRIPRIYHRDSSSDGGDAMETGESAASFNADNVSLRNGVSKDDVCVQSTTDNASVVSSSQEKGLRVRSFSFSHTSSNDSSNESHTVRRQRCTSTCHSPGRSGRSKEAFQIAYQGPFFTSEGFYQQIPSNSHKVQEFGSNTDSETDNDVKTTDNPVRSSEAIAVFDKNIVQSTSRTRTNSLSSSAEGDVESEVPADHDEVESKPARSKLRMSNNSEEAVVDSSEQQDEHRGIQDNQDDLKQLTCDKQSNNSFQVQNHSLKGDVHIGINIHCEPSTSKKNIVEREIEDSKISDVRVNIKEESPQSPHNPTSSRDENKVIEQEYASKIKAHETREGGIKEELVHPSRHNSTSASPSSSPDSQKCRNSSGEHCYSLRSRGPPTDAVDSASLSIDVVNEVPDNSSCRIPVTKKTEKVGEEEHADDEREKDEDDDDVTKDMEGIDELSDDKKRKRKRKTKKHRVNKKRKKKKVPESSGNKSPVLTTNRRLSPSPSSSSSQILCANVSSVELQNQSSSRSKEQSGNCYDTEMESSGDEKIFVNPPPHGCAVLDIKVMGDMVLTASSDGTARCYDLNSGRVMATYVDHTDVVTCVGVIGVPLFSADGPDFSVITGSADKTIRVFNGKTGEVKEHRVVGEGVRCLDIAWGQVFIGTEGGCGGRWNLKDKKVSEMVQYCGKAVTNLKAMTEGGRRVLLVAAKTTPLMIRDAMSGLFLRTLEHIQLTVYATVSYGGLLYTGGSNKTIVYYDFTSGNSRGHICCEADVSCLAIYSGHLIATCYDGLIRIFSIETGELLQRIPVETTNRMFICSALYKDRLLIGNKKGEVIGCQIPQITRQITR